MAENTNVVLAFIKRFLLNGIAVLVQFGKNGGWLGWNTADDVFQAFQSDGTTLSRVRGAAGVNNSDFATVGQMKALTGSIIVSGTFNGNSVPVDVTSLIGKYLFCETSGGTYVSGKIYTVNAITNKLELVNLLDGQAITVSTGMLVDAMCIAHNYDVGAEITAEDPTHWFYENYVYIYDADTGMYLTTLDTLPVVRTTTFKFGVGTDVQKEVRLNWKSIITKVTVIIEQDNPDAELVKLDVEFNQSYSIDTANKFPPFLTADLVDIKKAGKYSYECWEESSSGWVLRATSTITGTLVYDGNVGWIKYRGGAITVVVEYIDTIS